jgi:ribosome-associated translation inhibitor RaiA
MWIVLLSGILFGITSFVIILLLHLNNKYYKDLSELRQNAVAIYEGRLKDQAEENLQLSRETDQIIDRVRVLIQKHLRLQRDFDKLRLETDQVAQLNETLTNECFRLVQQTLQSDEQASELECIHEDFKELVSQKLALQVQYEASLETNRKLTERNNELEYAINLESISRVEGLEAQNKLYSAIDDVRRSLTRILTPA